nr:UPF0133 protein SSU98 [Streptococcus thermophilus]
MTQPEQPGMPDMQELIRQAAEVQEQMQRAQQELLAAIVQGTAGGGLVTITMSGTAEITDLKIDREAVDPDDVETLQDLILAAYRDAHTKVGQLTQEKFGPVAQSGADGGNGLSQMFGGQ